MEQKFKKDDWCFCEFELKQVKQTQDYRITEVTDGYFSHTSNDLSDRCFPLELHIKIISGHVSYWSKKIHELKNNLLNHPDLNRELVRRWIEICKNVDDKELVNTLCENLSKFCKDVIEKATSIKNEEVGGIKIFSR